MRLCFRNKPYLDSIVWREIADLILGLLKEKRKIICCITGKSGVGKSTIGKLIRQGGLPGINSRDFVVVDDGVVCTQTLFFFQKRVTIRSDARDELEPFNSYVANRKILIYVNARPDKRLSKTDLLVYIECDDRLRKERLMSRDANWEARYIKPYFDPATKMAADYVFHVMN